jgi:hypothetical protein
MFDIGASRLDVPQAHPAGRAGLPRLGVAQQHHRRQLTLDGECALEARDITSEELAGLLAAAIARPAEVPRLRLHLASLGVDVGRLKVPTLSLILGTCH